jgi:hypothetical protein
MPRFRLEPSSPIDTPKVSINRWTDPSDADPFAHDEENRKRGLRAGVAAYRKGQSPPQTGVYIFDECAKRAYEGAAELDRLRAKHGTSR